MMKEVYWNMMIIPTYMDNVVIIVIFDQCTNEFIYEIGIKK